MRFIVKMDKRCGMFAWCWKAAVEMARMRAMNV
jgi:hypothetical protein